MRNKSVRETLRLLAEDARDLVRMPPLDGYPAPLTADTLGSLEIVDRHEIEILAYIEQLEEENDKLKKEQAA